MIFLCGLFFPIESLPVFLKPLSYMLPLTYGVDILKSGIHGHHTLPVGINFLVIALFCIILFAISLRNIHRKWIIWVSVWKRIVKSRFSGMVTRFHMCNSAACFEGWCFSSLCTARNNGHYMSLLSIARAKWNCHLVRKLICSSR